MCSYAALYIFAYLGSTNPHPTKRRPNAASDDLDKAKKHVENMDNKRIIILDQVSDPQNVGAIIRSAYAFKMNALALSQTNSPLESSSMSKASSGAIEKLKINPPQFVYASPMQRTQESSELIASNLKLKIQTDSLIIETNIGNFQGKPSKRAQKSQQSR